MKSTHLKRSEHRQLRSTLYSLRFQSAGAMVFFLISISGRAQDTNSPPSGAAPAAPAGILPIPAYSGDFWTRARLTGDWWGARTNLANKGVQFDIDWTQYAQGIPSGGREQEAEYGGHLDYLLHLDLMRMNLIPGALITVRAESRYGSSVNGFAGTVLPVNTTAFFPLTKKLDENVAIAITDLNYTQFLGEHLAVLFGKLDTLDADLNEFASGRGKSQFMDANFLFDSVAALRLPYSTLGAGALWLPTKNISVKASIINTVDSSTTTGFDDFDGGQTVSGEADFQYRLGQLPGGMNVGGLYSFDQDFTKISGRLLFQPGVGLIIPSASSTWAVYWSTWQYLYVADPDDKPIDVSDGRPDHKGIGLFARAGFADKDTNPIKWSASGGIGGRGLIPTRDNDTYGLGYYFTSYQTTRISSAVGIRDQGQGMEAFYNLAITPAAQLTFDFQLQDSPLPHVDTAVILGARLNLSF